MARPKKYNIDNKQVQNLARLGCTNIEIANFFGCDESLIRHSYSEFLIKGRSEQKMRLRQLQWNSAERGNIVMQIFLGKNLLGQTDKIETTNLEKPLPWSYDD
tara:strand:+ start:3607 stop:3915 length:309 start_codon:yes stop_codon:yes gene_type:complete